MLLEIYQFQIMILIGAKKSLKSIADKIAITIFE